MVMGKEEVPLELMSIHQNKEGATGLHDHSTPVKICSFFPEISVPVISQTPRSAMSDILGSGDGAIFSPEGYKLEERYYMPRTPGDSSRGGCIYHDKQEYTERSEGIVRPWMMHYKAFQDELTNNGWFVFPAAESLEDDERKELKKQGHNVYDSSRVLKRSVKLSDLVKLMKLTTAEEDAGKPVEERTSVDKYALAMADLEELMPYVDDTELVWEHRSWGSGSSLHMLRGTATLGERSAIIELTKLDHLIDPNTFLEKSDRFYSRLRSEDPNTLLRTVKIPVPIKKEGEYWYPSCKAPSWWDNEATKMVVALAKSHIGKHGIDNTSIESKKNGFLVQVGNRNTYGDSVLAPDTGKLLTDVFGICDIMASAIGLEYAEHNAARRDTFLRRSDRLGLME